MYVQTGPSSRCTVARWSVCDDMFSRLIQEPRNADIDSKACVCVYVCVCLESDAYTPYRI